jgi:hypothetical protein
MRPERWEPSIGVSAAERAIIKRIRRAKLFIFLRAQRHEIFDEGFQEELATALSRQSAWAATSGPCAFSAGDDSASVYGSL